MTPPAEWGADAAGDDRPTGRFACDHAWIDGGMVDRVVIDVTGDRITGLTTHAEDFAQVAAEETHLAGVTIPGLVNAHSHAFHRALRGRLQAAHGPTGSFWSWRDHMYAVAEALDPDRYHDLAVGVFGEMALAGITCVGEFHYLHHDAGGARHMDPNAMGTALLAAAEEVGIRITLLDALYLTGDVGATLEAPDLDAVQARFSDGSVDAWLARLEDLVAIGTTATSRIGAALHSVRAVPADAVGQAVDGLAGAPFTHDLVVHAHVAEQPAEVQRCHEVHGASPVQLLADAGAVDARFTAVHGVWVDDDDIAALGRASATVCACPTTERDLADGIVPAGRLLAAGAGLCLGSDQHAVIDLFEEARAVELDLRLHQPVRGSISPARLLRAATTGGARSLGWPETGRIEVGALADLCTIGWDGVGLAGVPADAAGVVFAATAGDVTHTVVGGRVIVADGQHRQIDVAGRLATAITEVRTT